MGSEKIVPAVRDLGMLVVGGYGFGWTVTHGASMPVMLLCALVMTGPAAIALLASRSGTQGSDSSRSQVSSSQRSRLPSSSGPAGDES